MPVKRVIRGDLDKVYIDSNAECFLICSYILSKGDIKTNKLSNKYCNIEILEANKMYYLAITSGRLGVEDNVQVRRFNSEVIVKKLYLDECKKREKEGYSKVEVVSIYPHCSECAKKFVSEKNIISKDVAKEIKEKNKDKVLPKEVKKESKKSEINPKVAKLVSNIYYEANQVIAKNLDPSSFQNSDSLMGMINLNMINRGREILKEIAVYQNKLVVAKRNISKLEYIIAELSNQYNSTIPRVFY